MSKEELEALQAKRHKAYQKYINAKKVRRIRSATHKLSVNSLCFLKRSNEIDEARPGSIATIVCRAYHLSFLEGG